MPDDDQGTSTPANIPAELESLRRENRTWRKKVHELEAQNQLASVGMELARRGITADPSWVKLDEGVEIGEAIDSFVQQYPQLATRFVADEEHEEPAPRATAPAALPPSSKQVNGAGPPAKGATRHRNLEEIKKDPVARQRLREEYRELLKNSSHQVDNFT